MKELEQLFYLSSTLAKGKIKWDRIDGKNVPITIKQRQAWARVAAYIAQTIGAITEHFDQHEIDSELAELEKLVNEASAKKEVAAPEGKV
jgi:hypothetical protein